MKNKPTKWIAVYKNDAELIYAVYGYIREDGHLWGIWKALYDNSDKWNDHPIDNLFVSDRYHIHAADTLFDGIPENKVKNVEPSVRMIAKHRTLDYSYEVSGRMTEDGFQADEWEETGSSAFPKTKGTDFLFLKGFYTFEPITTYHETNH